MFGFVQSIGLPSWPAILHSESGGRMKVTFLGTNQTLLIKKKEWMPYTQGEFDKVDTSKNKRRWGALKAGLKQLREALNGEKGNTVGNPPKKGTKSDKNKQRVGLRKQQRDNEQKFAEIMKKLMRRQWQCLRCNFKTGYKYRAKTHALLCSSMFRARKKRNKVYLCDSCPGTTTFSSKRLLKRHNNKEHPRTFLCVEHPRPIRFTLRQNLLRHMEEKHPKKEIKTFVCPECGLKTYRKDNLSRHVMRRHPRRQQVIEILLNLAEEVVEKIQTKNCVESLFDQIITKVVKVNEESFKESEDAIEENNKSQNLSNLERIVNRILETVEEPGQNKTHIEENTFKESEDDIKDKNKSQILSNCERIVDRILETVEEPGQNRTLIEENSFKKGEDDIEDKNKSQNLSNAERIVKRILETVKEKRQNKNYVESLVDKILNNVVTRNNNTDYEQKEIQKRKNDETDSTENSSEPKRKVAKMKDQSFKSGENIEDVGTSVLESKSQKVDCLERIEANKKEFQDLYNKLFKEEIEAKIKLKQMKALENMAKKEALKRKREEAANHDEPRRKSARLLEQSISPSGDSIIEQEDSSEINIKCNTKALPMAFKCSEQSKECIDKNINTIDLSGESDEKNGIKNVTERDSDIDDHVKENEQSQECIEKNINIIDLSGNSDENNETENATEGDSDIDDHDKENVKPNKKSKRYECNKHSKCSYKARDNFNLQKHMRKKHEEGPVACTKPWCKVMIETVFEQELHVKMCVSICKKCGKSFSRPSKWYEHQRYEAAQEVKLSM